MHFMLFILNVHFTMTVVYGAQIFAFVPIYGQSHWNVMDAVLQTLVSAGHNRYSYNSFYKKRKNWKLYSGRYGICLIVCSKDIQEYNLLPLFNYVCFHIMVGTALQQSMVFEINFNFMSTVSTIANVKHIWYQLICIILSILR